MGGCATFTESNATTFFAEFCFATSCSASKPISEAHPNPDRECKKGRTRDGVFALVSVPAVLHTSGRCHIHIVVPRHSGSDKRLTVSLMYVEFSNEALKNALIVGISAHRDCEADIGRGSCPASQTPYRWRHSGDAITADYPEYGKSACKYIPCLQLLSDFRFCWDVGDAGK